MASDEPAFNGEKPHGPPFHDQSYNENCHHRFYYCNMNSRVMLTAVICLVLVIIIVVILHIYAKMVLRRRARAAPRPLAQGVTQIHTGEPLKRGLDPLIISSLPMFVFKQANPNKESYYASMDCIECAVCLSMLEEEEMARLLPNCKHIFHAECIDKWLNSQSTCPICRAEVEPRVIQPQQGEGDGAPQTSTTALQDVVAVGESSGKAGGLGSRMSSFKRILSGERPSRRTTSCGDEDGIQDLERQ